MENIGGDILPILESIENEKGLSKGTILKLIEQSILSAFKRHNNKFTNVRVNVGIDGAINLYCSKKIVDKVSDHNKEIALKDALEIDRKAKIGENIEIKIGIETFGRIAAQTAKQVIIQKIRETEREKTYKEYKGKEGSIISGYIAKMINETPIIYLDKVEAILPYSEQIEKESYYQGMFLKACILKIEDNSRGVKLILSRKSHLFLKKLLELEVPEISEGIIEIKNVVRSAGERAKVAVISKNSSVDPVGSIVGVKGVRIKNIVDELSGERIDLVIYDDDPKKYIENALKPANISDIKLNLKEKNAEVFLDEKELAIAVGKKGVNVKLAARLTGWHIDIKAVAEKYQ